jgi:hypothetical protein
MNFFHFFFREYDFDLCKYHKIPLGISRSSKLLDDVHPQVSRLGSLAAGGWDLSTLEPFASAHLAAQGAA